MHCRIGCRLNGGFIECLDDRATILINGVPRNRARLSDGDRIRIGILEISVDIPQQPKPQVFEIAFDDEDERKDTDANAIDHQPTATPFIDDELLSDETKELSAELESKSVAESEEAVSKAVPVEIVELKPTKPVSAEIENTNSEKPVFEFDSVDPTDTDITGDDLEAIENMTGNSLVMQDLAFSAEETFPDHFRNKREQKSPAKTEPEVPPTDAAENILDGGSSQGGKCWRWGGRSVLAAIETLQRMRQDLNCFHVQQHVSLSACSFDTIKQAATDRQEVSIYLLSSQAKGELLRQLFSKRWNERLTHPEALSMSLSLLPTRNVASLFEYVDTAVLVQNGDVEMVRLNNLL